MGHILKSDCVEVEGRFSLNKDVPQPGTEPSEGADQARIVEQHEGFSIIELVCSCGRTLQVRCEHPA